VKRSVWGSKGFFVLRGLARVPIDLVECMLDPNKCQHKPCMCVCMHT